MRRSLLPPLGGNLSRPCWACGGAESLILDEVPLLPSLPLNEFLPTRRLFFALASKSLLLRLRRLRALRLRAPLL